MSSELLTENGIRYKIGKSGSVRYWCLTDWHLSSKTVKELQSIWSKQASERLIKYHEKPEVEKIVNWYIKSGKWEATKMEDIIGE